MNSIADEILSHYGESERGYSGTATKSDNEFNSLAMYGTKFHSGRYPWGSGEDPYQHDDIHGSKPVKSKIMDGSVAWYDNVNKLKMKDNFTYKDPATGKVYEGELAIAKYCGLDSTTEFRTAYRVAKNYKRSLEVAQAEQLRQAGYSLDEIAKKMGKNNDSSIRSLLDESSKARSDQARETANQIKMIVDDINKDADTPQMLDIGVGIEKNLGVTKTKLDEALYILQAEEGYVIGGAGIPQATNKGQQTNIKVIGPANTTQKDIYSFNNIHYNLSDTVTSYDNGETFHKAFEFPSNLDSKRLQIVYAEDGGKEKDGLIEVRPGVKDLSLDGSTYCQARIMVDNSLYLKGMCVYNDDLPEGIDVRFNTNKTKDKSLSEVLKPLKTVTDENGVEVIDKDNPFGSLIKEKRGQNYYTDENGKQQLGLINKRADEGDWYEWTDTLPSQFISKQSIELINKQIKKTEDDLDDEYNDILQISNPTVRKKFLLDYAQSCDKQAVDLKVASLPRQKYQVIIPVSSLKDNEVYAPNFEEGEKVALIRFPHASIAEIPILTVNNKNAEASKTLGKNPADAIGINARVAQRLSGADFDGDTVMVIPTIGNGKNLGVDISNREPYEQLANFDPSEAYPEVPGMKYMKYKKEGTNKTIDNTQRQMGEISNLITDMTLAGAPDEDMVKAIKHSMVVIDAGKHKLNYKQSEIDNDISELKNKYQGRYKNGKWTTSAATIISAAKGEATTVKTKGSPTIHEDGTITYKQADTYIDIYTGEVKNHTQKTTNMALTDDAFTLVRDRNNPKEVAYANYANHLKALANKARKEWYNTIDIAYSPTAKEKYSKEVSSLNDKLDIAQANAPRERAAQAIANTRIKDKIALYDLDPTHDGKEIRKISQQQLTKAREEVGAKRQTFSVTDKEWEAIQSGAISKTKLTEIMRYADNDDLRAKSMPKETNALTDRQIQKIEQMMSTGNYTTAQVAQALGISTSSVMKYENGKTK